MSSSRYQARSWGRYAECETCGAKAGRACWDRRTKRGSVEDKLVFTMKTPHKGRRQTR